MAEHDPEDGHRFRRDRCHYIVNPVIGKRGAHRCLSDNTWPFLARLDGLCEVLYQPGG